MPGTRAGGLKAAATNKARYGDEFYKRMGQRGGSASTDRPKGFAANPKLASDAGKRGGMVTGDRYKTRKGILCKIAKAIEAEQIR